MVRVFTAGLTAAIAFCISSSLLFDLADAATVRDIVVDSSYPAQFVTNPVSAWNKQVPSSATYSPIATRLGGLDSWYGADWSIPFYVANPNNASMPATNMPLLYSPLAWTNVWSGRWKRKGNTPAIEAEILANSYSTFPWAGNPYSSISTTSWVLPTLFHRNALHSGAADQYYYSTAMTPAMGSDGHLAVLQPSGNVIETYGTIILSTGQVVALSYAVTNPAGLCDGFQDGQTASMLPSYAGVISDQEMLAGSINHAIAVTIPAGLLTPAAVYPAFAFDRAAMRQNPPYSGNVPMGARLAIPYSTNITALHLSTPEGRILAAAAQTYGFIVADQGGGGIAIRVNAKTAVVDTALRTYSWPVTSDLNKIMAALKRVN